MQLTECNTKTHTDDAYGAGIDLMKKAVNEPNDLNLATLFAQKSKLKVLCVNLDKYVSYYFDEVTTLYVPITINELAAKVRDELIVLLTQHVRLLATMHDVADEEGHKQFTTARTGVKKVINKVSGHHCIMNVTKTLCTLVMNRDFLAQLDSEKTTVNFKNGLVDLITGRFRVRTSRDAVSKCLSYEYSETRDEVTIERIMTMLLNICNDDLELLEGNLSWFGYNLTGLTREQKFMFTVGHSASNGKTTLTQMFTMAFDIYCELLDKQAFEESYTKAYTEFACILPITRMIVVEEGDRKKLDCSRLKQFADGLIKCEIMYGTSDKKAINGKLNLISNKTPFFENDNGLARRGYLQYLTNQFVSADKLQASKRKGVYARDSSLKDVFFCTPQFKLSFFHILLPHAMNYLKRGLTIPKVLADQYDECCAENDKMKSFVEERCITTDNAKDKIHKDEFLAEFAAYHKLPYITWNNILNDVKRLELRYAPKDRVNGSGQGCLTHIKWRGQEDDDEVDDVAASLDHGNDKFKQ